MTNDVQMSNSITKTKQSNLVTENEKSSLVTETERSNTITDSKSFCSIAQESTFVDLMASSVEIQMIKIITSVQVNFHQANDLFGLNAGLQCVPNCLSALSYHKPKLAHLWQS